MPLLKPLLKEKLEARILTLEPKLFLKLQKKTTGLYKAQLIVDQKLSNEPPASGFDMIQYKNKLWQTVADEWGKVIAKEVIKIIAEDVSRIVADEMDTYIRSATIISPAGQTTTPAALGAPVTTITPAAPSAIT